MYAETDVKSIEDCGKDLSGVIKTLKMLEDEIDSVNRTLALQPEFSSHASKLRDINTNMSDARYKLSSLTRALRNIAGIYRRTENLIVEGLENAKPSYAEASIKNNDFTDVGERTNRVLYGGDR